MAIASGSTFEVRTTGVDTNGGGFVTGATGTDYSQQASAQYALTGLTSAGSGNTVLYASASADMVGNIAQVISGTNFTTGFFQIVSVVVGTSITFSTNSASASICTGVGANGVINIGGAFVSPGIGSLAASASGNTIWIRSGTYTIASTSNNVATGCMAPTVAVNIRGYGSTRGDYGTKPLIQANGSITSFILVAGTGGFVMENLAFDGNNRTSSRGITQAGTNSVIYLCTFTNFTNGAAVCSSGTMKIVRCYATTCSAVVAFQAFQAYYCVAVGNTIGGFTVISSGGSITHCISYNNTGASSDGIVMGGAGQQCKSCVAYGNGRDGIRFTNGVMNTIFDSVAYGNAGNGFNTTVTPLSTYMFTNFAGGNGTADFAAAIPASVQNNSTVLTADPFTNASGLDFSPNTTLGGGNELRGVNTIGFFPGLVTNNFEDSGAAQHPDFDLPDVGDVRFGVGYGDGANPMIGTLVVPDASDVRAGVVFDNGTVGTLAAGGGNNILGG